ncbi:MAG: DnaD domain protein [Oscillospiraceae bacterium]|nr:DnaD domain protein [Oscillospiraceae bacterium]
MVYNIDISRWGGFFNVPISVAQNFLKLASEQQLKVLLYILSQGSPVVDCDNVSLAVGVTSEEVEEAVLFWQSVGVISIEGKERTKAAPPVSTAAVVTTEAKVPAEAPKPKKIKLTYNPSDIAKLAQSNEDIKNILQQAQTSLCKTITNSDQIMLLNLYEYYGFPAATIIMLCDYCKSTGNVSPAYIEKVAKSWYDEGIIDPKDADAKVKYLMEYHSFENEIKRRLGLNAATTTKQGKYFDSWNKRGFTPELIEYAGELSIDGTDKHIVSLEYMESILSSWEANSIATLDDAKNHLSESKQASKKKTSNTSSATQDAASRYDDDVDKYLKKHGLL